MADTAASIGSLSPAGSSEIACPHCGGTNRKQPASDAIVDCRHCDRSYAQPRTPAAARAGASGEAASAAAARSPTDVGLRLTGAVGAVITLAFYLAVVEPLSDTYFGELFGARGWVPYLITWLSFWAASLLVAKAWLLSGQRRALELDLLPDSIAARITPSNAREFAIHLREIAGRELGRDRLASQGRNLLVGRAERALEHFRVRGRAADVIEQLGNQSQLDANAVDSSYTMIRVFIWAIPLLGFIGTVLGISAAVAGFSDSVAEAVDLDVMKQSIGAVTTGLGIAFDTTLLALVMSILIMFPTSSLQKSEEDFLNAVERYCEERLGRRLDDERDAAEASAGRGAALAVLADGAAESLGRLESRLMQLTTTLGRLDERLAASAATTATDDPPSLEDAPTGDPAGRS